MIPIRPAALFTGLALVALASALAAQPLTTVADEADLSPISPSPTASADPAAPTTAIAVTPSPSRRELPHIEFIKPSPWKFGGTVPPTPSPTPRVKRPKPSRKTPRKSSHPHAIGKPTLAPTAVRTPVPTPTPTPAPAPTPTPTAEPTDTPKPPSHARRALKAAPPPSAPTLSPTSSAVTPVLPIDAGATPIPTQPPTPRPLAPNQPSIPDSMADPNVRGIIERPIRQLSQIGWMQGTWSVTGVTNKEDGTTLPIEPTTYVFSTIMKNRWMFGADGRATDYIYLTFDPFTRHWVALRFGGNPSYGMWVSERGWIGNRIDFITNFSYVNGRQYRRRLTIIHKDARTFGIYETEQTPDGSFIPDDAYEFKKQ